MKNEKEIPLIFMDSVEVAFDAECPEDNSFYADLIIDLYGENYDSENSEYH